MADDVIAGSGDGLGPPFATDKDEVGNRHYPWIKLAFGPDNTFTKLADANGTRLPVKIGSGLEAGSVVAGQVSLSGAETALTSVAARWFRVKAQTTNSDVIYLGPTGVTTGTGFPVWPGDVLDLEVANLDVIHAIVGSGTQTLCYFGLV